MDHLNQVFQANGFPEGLVKKTLAARPPPCSEPSETQQQHDAPNVLCTPYIKSLSERIEKVCAPLGVKPVFKPKRTLRQDLMQVKTRTQRRSRQGSPLQ